MKFKDVKLVKSCIYKKPDIFKYQFRPTYKKFHFNANSSELTELQRAKLFSKLVFAVRELSLHMLNLIEKTKNSTARTFRDRLACTDYAEEQLRRGYALQPQIAYRHVRVLFQFIHVAATYCVGQLGKSRLKCTPEDLRILSAVDLNTFSEKRYKITVVPESGNYSYTTHVETRHLAKSLGMIHSYVGINPETGIRQGVYFEFDWEMIFNILVDFLGSSRGLRWIKFDFMVNVEEFENFDDEKMLGIQYAATKIAGAYATGYPDKKINTAFYQRWKRLKVANSRDKIDRTTCQEVFAYTSVCHILPSIEELGYNTGWRKSLNRVMFQTDVYEALYWYVNAFLANPETTEDFYNEFTSFVEVLPVLTELLIARRKYAWTNRLTKNLPITRDWKRLLSRFDRNVVVPEKDYDYFDEAMQAQKLYMFVKKECPHIPKFRLANTYHEWIINMSVLLHGGVPKLFGLDKYKPQKGSVQDNKDRKEKKRRIAKRAESIKYMVNRYKLDPSILRMIPSFDDMKKALKRLDVLCEDEWFKGGTLNTLLINDRGNMLSPLVACLDEWWWMKSTKFRWTKQPKVRDLTILDLIFMLMGIPTISEVKHLSQQHNRIIKQVNEMVDYFKFLVKYEDVFRVQSFVGEFGGKHPDPDQFVLAYVEYVMKRYPETAYIPAGTFSIQSQVFADWIREFGTPWGGRFPVISTVGHFLRTSAAKSIRGKTAVFIQSYAHQYAKEVLGEKEVNEIVDKLYFVKIVPRSTAKVLCEDGCGVELRV